ncbi:hypothetical protein CNEO4_1050010 [Clostridium neonatale]|uniref:Uncharacterized protein n=1 Tax=Clostridium neonatale TaxID=137838 RepID=A0AA86JW20_9CLOT|nr:hypothetical protein CNEO_42064 [Clostridium neonatale]DAM04878.1 MAG TPA: hypothetical protein [Caudoviricetes sp.]CAI3210974.1 hypothetical protein CNEO2_660024 [Clostridium neonatale]CAI3213455.1 hypothetical protein CNEO2_690013 [Clostridium neonatale]CAI3215115.1 hypothetical protein CNEO2_780012 [Clostridium neonatale]
MKLIDFLEYYEDLVEEADRVSKAYKNRHPQGV